MSLLIILLFAALFACAIAGAVAYTHAQVWQERAERHQREAATLGELLSESEASYQALQWSLQTGGWVRIPADAEIEAGKWN